MDFTPNDGFCCPFVERLPSTSEFEPVTAKFLAWVKSLPVNHQRPKKYGYGYASTVVALKDQPYVIKIVEEGYAFMFQGAFAPREEGYDATGFDRIPYFDLVTSDFKEMQLYVFFPPTKVLVANRVSIEGEVSEVVVCEKHEKRFLLSIHIKTPRITDSWSKDLRTAASTLKLLEQSCEVQEIDTIPVTATVPLTTSGEDGRFLVSMEPSQKSLETHKPQVSSTSQQSDKGSWTWL